MAKFSETAKRCLAVTYSGKPCPNPAVKESDLCWQHHRCRHPDRIGTLRWWQELPDTLDITDDEEQALMISALEAIDDDFDLNESTDRMQALMSSVYFAKWVSACRENNLELAAAHDHLLQKNLKCLKATRDSREGVESKVSTPAEWATDLLEEYNSRQVEKAVEKSEKGKNAAE